MAIISMDKQYKTRRGRDVLLLTTNGKRASSAVVAILEHGKDNEAVVTYYANGKLLSTNTHDLDLIEVSPFEAFEIDDKVWVWDEDMTIASPRHFAGVRTDGYPLTWADGKTSFSIGIEGYKTMWDYCTKEKPNGT